MQRFWVQWGSLGMVLALLVGCRTTQPDLKPPKQSEELNVAPQGEARYDRPYYPKEALARDDFAKKMKDVNQAIMPTRGGPGGMGGMGGGAGGRGY